MSVKEAHRSNRSGWLRAAVLGANDGTISIASLVVGVASAGGAQHAILLTGLSGLVGGTVAMAAGEYVSVQSQSDTEHADIALEARSLASDPERELAELTALYSSRGLDDALAGRVAEALMASDAIGAHARDELGITESLRARPVQAALASGLSFAVGSILPLTMALVAPSSRILAFECGTALASLAILGATAAYVGGAAVVRGGARVAFWGALALGLTSLVGRMFGATA